MKGSHRKPPDWGLWHLTYTMVIRISNAVETCVHYVAVAVTSSRRTRVALELPEESGSLRADVSVLLRSKGVSPRPSQMALHRWEWKKSAMPWVPRFPSPYSFPEAVWIWGTGWYQGPLAP